MRLVGANPKAKSVGEKRLKAKINYFLGNDTSLWKTNVPAFEQVRTKDVYPGIDLVNYGQATGALEYDLVVAAGADTGQIRLAFEGADSVKVADNGDLVMRTAAGEVRQQKPVCYQYRAGQRVAVNGEFAQVASGNEIGFKLQAYDRTAPLIIDPVLGYSTYLGGGGTDLNYGIATDGTGCAFVTGETGSTNFPGTGGNRGNRLDSDAFVTVLDTNRAGAASLVYSAYIGGTSNDIAWDIAADAKGRVFVTGETDSTDFPTQRPFQDDQIGDDAFVTVLDIGETGAASLLYSSYLGGSHIDRGLGIATDGSGRAFVAGQTHSLDFPMAGAYQGNQPAEDAFVAVLDTTNVGTVALLYSTYLGGNANDIAWDIAVDGDGRAYVTGATQANDFPTVGQYQDHQSGQDCFVSVFDTGASGVPSLLYSTFLGGGSADFGYGIAIGPGGYAYVTGITGSSDFAAVQGYQGDQPGNDAFVAVINPGATGAGSLRYSTYLGGSGDDFGNDIAVNPAGVAFITGYAISGDFPTTAGRYQGPLNLARRVFVTAVDPSKAGAPQLVYGTYLGGLDAIVGPDEGTGIAVDNSGRVLVTGFTYNDCFPTTGGAYQSDQAALDGFISVFKFGPGSPASLLAAPASGVRGIDLAWTDDASDNTGYTLERRRNGYANWNGIATLGDVTSFRDTAGLLASETYEYRVRSFNNLGYSDWITANATMPPPPTAPSGLLATAVSTSRINLSWSDNSGDETSFRIERKTGDGSYTQVGAVAAGVTSSGSTSLKASTTYTFRVRAVRGTDISAPSNEADATTLIPPAAPSGLAAVAVGAGRINLTWIDNSSDETGFRIERMSGGGSFAPIGTVGAGVTASGSTGLSASTEYIFRVRALRGVDVSTPSDEAVATTLAPVSPPTALHASVLGSSRVNLTWADQSSDEDGFKIERKSAGGSFASFATVGAGITNFTSTGLAASTEYYFRVRAYRGADLSAYSNETSATTVSSVAAPSALSATASGSRRIVLTWSDNSSDENGFKVERKSGTGSYVAIATLGPGTTSFVDAGLTAGAEYTYRISAYRQFDSSPYCDPASATANP
jgi:hypothetical protein